MCIIRWLAQEKAHIHIGHIDSGQRERSLKICEMVGRVALLHNRRELPVPARIRLGGHTPKAIFEKETVPSQFMVGLCTEGHLSPVNIHKFQVEKKFQKIEENT